MAKNRQFYIYKLNSTFLNKNEYKCDINFKTAILNEQIISIGDSQMLRTIRSICGRYIDQEEIELLFNRKNEFQKKPTSKENSAIISAIRKKIYDNMFVPEYVSVLIDKLTHYRKMCKSGFTLNGVKYKRFSCSASQARVSTVIFIAEHIYDDVYEILDNGRKKLPISPAKENAYFGLYSSATKIVRTPRVCVVDDCIVYRDTLLNWVIENNDTEVLSEDDIEQKYVNFEYNLFDGMGLIHPEFAKLWAEDLDLGYIPDQFCIRHSFTKGMLCQIDYIDFAVKKNNSNYIIEDIYGKKHDVRQVDVILSKSQFKMWNFYDSYEDFVEKCGDKLVWGISQMSPKKLKRHLKLNYQSIQTLSLNQDQISELCKETTDMFNSILDKSAEHAMLCMMGDIQDIDFMHSFMEKSEDYSLKSLILDKSLLKDSYIHNKIYSNISEKIKNTYLGEIFVSGNYQVMISDPYAFCEHIFNLPVKGLLDDKEQYSKYWINRDVWEVDAMRSPLTYKSEHNVLNLKNNDETEYWYRYMPTGIIFNVHGDDVIRFADSDFDMDIVATTDNKTILQGVYRDTLPVSYEKKNTPKKINTFKDLCDADIRSFGSKIGQITNKSTSMYAMQCLYEPGTPEYNTMEKRLILTRKLQGNEIDAAKGIERKPFPKHWTNFISVREEDTPEVKEQKIYSNQFVIEKKPFFFTQRYSTDRSKYKSYHDGRDKYCRVTFGKSLDSLIKSEKRTEQEEEFMSLYYRYSPFLHTDCVMNKLYEHMNNSVKQIKISRKENSDSSIWKKYVSTTSIDMDMVDKLKRKIKKYNKDMLITWDFDNTTDTSKTNYKLLVAKFLKEDLEKTCSNKEVLVNCLVYLYYTQFKTKINTLWTMYGEDIYNNIKYKTYKYTAPVLNDSCTVAGKNQIMYMNSIYDIVELDNKITEIE